MKIHGVRMGLATNSSSSHSLIFLPDAADRDVSSAEFGWSHFTAASTKARRDYLALTLHSALCAAVGEDIAELVTAAWVGQSAPKDGSVDHQSQYVMPQRWDGRCIDKDFFDDFSAFMLQKGLVILGGNDNDDGHEHPLADGTEFTLPLPRDEHGAAYVARKDGTYWAVFNRKNGTKIRFSFERDAAPPMRATLPELVDVKITDLCTRGCLFCYQDSTPRGEHASRGVLDVLACALGQARVFEVAIGGGEPTAHPDFVQVLRDFRTWGVVPSFTTRSLAWLRDPSIWCQALMHAGAFALTVATGEEVMGLAALLHVNGIDPDRAGVQYVMGMGDLENVLLACGDVGLRVTLLGYKRVGRGANVQPGDYSHWLSVVRRAQERNCALQVAIDTTLAAESGAALSAEGVPDLFYETKDGRFSMYVDAVAWTAAPSSYCDPSLFRPLPKYLDVARLGEMFRAFGGT